MDKTIVNFLLDETGSMMDCRDETISGFNEYIQTLKKDKDVKIHMTLTKFNSEKVEVVYVDKAIDKVPVLTQKTYKPDAMTPLFDAIGKTAKELDNKLANSKEKKKVVFVVMTDGEENFSKEYKKDDIKALIKDKEKEGWTFTFMGADIDAWSSYRDLGLQRGNVMSFDKKDIGGAFVRAGGATMQYAKGSRSSTNKFFGK